MNSYYGPVRRTQEQMSEANSQRADGLGKDRQINQLLKQVVAAAFIFNVHRSSEEETITLLWEGSLAIWWRM